MITKLLLICAAVAEPCNCENKTSFLQRVSNSEETTPCGCNVQRTTPREILRNLPLPALQQRQEVLEKEVKQLKTDVDRQTAEHKKDRGARRKQVDAMWKAQSEHENKTEDEDEARSKEIHKHSDEVKTLEQEQEKLNAELTNLRKEWSAINEEVTSSLMKMASCPGCNGKQLALVRQNAATNIEPMELVIKIERLELERNSLITQLTDNLTNYRSEMRRLDSEQEKVEQKAARYDALEDKYRHQDQKRQKLIKDQIAILQPVVEDRKKTVEKTKKSIQEAKDHLKNLSAEIAKCCK